MVLAEDHVFKIDPVHFFHHVAEYFPDNTKQRYNAAVEAIRSTYAERIEKLDWMSAATKAKAREKLAAVTKKVGYPDKWKDYSALTVSRAAYAENVMNAFFSGAGNCGSDSRGYFGVGGSVGSVVMMLKTRRAPMMSAATAMSAMVARRFMRARVLPARAR